MLILTRNRRAVETSSVVLTVFFIVSIFLLGYFAYQYVTSVKASISISMGSSCSQINFKVTNNDNRILHGWVALLQESPATSNIIISPSSVAVIALAPGGSYSGTFNIGAPGAPPGNYQFTGYLVNGTSTIATSSSLACSVS